VEWQGKVVGSRCQLLWQSATYSGVGIGCGSKFHKLGRRDAVGDESAFAVPFCLIHGPVCRPQQLIGGGAVLRGSCGPDAYSDVQRYLVEVESLRDAFNDASGNRCGLNRRNSRQQHDKFIAANTAQKIDIANAFA